MRTKSIDTNEITQYWGIQVASYYEVFTNSRDLDYTAQPNVTNYMKM